MKRYARLLALLAALMLMAECAAPGNAPSPEQTVEPAVPAQTETATAQNTSQAADASQMTAVEEVTEEGMEPIPAASLRSGTYPVTVESSSSMFRVTDCLLTVTDGAMTAAFTLGGSSYGYVYPGTAEQAAAAEEADYISVSEDAEGKNTFTLPIEALDQGFPCAAWSKNKELWYDRTLLLRADSLPVDAFEEGTFPTAESLGLADGSYTAEVTLTGGSGKASVVSPASLRVAQGLVTAEIVWSSANYDYMLVDGEKYLAEIVDGHSVFEIPVARFDRPIPVTADTTAMSRPHEIQYALRFDSATLQLAEG